MAFISSSLKPVVDQPVWEWVRLVTAPNLASVLLTGDNENDTPYLYYWGFAGSQTGTNHYRYDTRADGWQPLMPVYNTSFTTTAASSGRYCTSDGMRGRVITGSINTIRGAAVPGSSLVGKKILIYDGKGMGQERTIKKVTGPIVHDYGSTVSQGSNINMLDTTKKWKSNQWVGYMISVFNGDISTNFSGPQRRVIYSNSSNRLNFQSSYPPGAPTAWFRTPYNQNPLDGYGLSGTIIPFYQIESFIIEVDKNWNVIPDFSSRYVIKSDIIYYNTTSTNVTSAPVFNLFAYDVAQDANNSFIATPDCYKSFNHQSLIEIIRDNGDNPYFTGSVISGTNRLIRYNSHISSSVDRWTNHEVRIISGSGLGQRRRIIANTTSSIEINQKWDIPYPTTGSIFSVVNNSSNIYLGGRGNAGLFIHNKEKNIATHGQYYDSGYIRRIAIGRSGSFEEYVGTHNNTVAFNAVKTVNPIPAVKGSGYAVGDVLTLTSPSNAASVYVEEVGSGGTVERVSLAGGGYSYSVGTYSTTGGTGTGCTISVTSVGTNIQIQFLYDIDFKAGERINMYGASYTPLNTSYTILASGGQTMEFSIPVGFTGSVINRANTFAANVVVDGSKNWDIDEHTGRILHLYDTANPSTTLGAARKIISNTATTLTLSSNLAFTPVNDMSYFYTIEEAYSTGRAEQYTILNKGSSGYANSGSKSTLVDNNKNWNINQWSGSTLRIMAGPGLSKEITITSNNQTTLNFATQTFSPNPTTKYQIKDSFGTITSFSVTSKITDTTKRWTPGQWYGRTVLITAGGTNTSYIGYEAIIVGNTANELLLNTGVMNINDTDVTYTILGAHPRFSGTDLHHNWNSSNKSKRGRYLYSANGSSGARFNPLIDRYDIVKDTWETGITLFPSSNGIEVFAGGTNFVYDQEDSLYVLLYNQTVSDGSLIRINLDECKVYPLGCIPYNTGQSNIAPKLALFKTKDGLKYLYYIRTAGDGFFRTLLLQQLMSSS